MPYFFYWLGQYPTVLQWFVICTFIFSGLILVIIASKVGWLYKISISRDGVHFMSREKEEIKAFESGRINKILDDKIVALDVDLFEFALEQTNKLERTMRIKMSDVSCVSTRQALAACIRPLWRAARKNNFKNVLRPENIKTYVDERIKEIIAYYQELSIEKDIANCAVNTNMKCQDLPALDVIIEILKKEIVENWAIPIRREVVKVCDNKIKEYEEQIPLYKDLRDGVREKVALHCIQKNKDHKTALTRPPVAGEI